MPETMGEERPRIYVSCLATYNGGSYHGVWIDATKSADDIQKCVDKMLSTSKEPYAGEWAIHDFENFHEIRIGEWERFEKVSETANALVKHGPAYSAFVKLFDEDEHGPDKFTDKFIGEYEGRVDFAQYWCDEYHPELLEQHLITIDYESTWRQLQIAQVCRGIRTQRGFFVFNS